MHVDGQCRCGRVTFKADIDPQAVSICHCIDCQALTGSPFRVTVLCSGSRIHTAGSPKIYARSGDNGRLRYQHFCGDCGSPLFSSGEGEHTDDWGIRWGAIRQRAALRPARQIRCRSAVPWLNEIAELPRRPED
jgi:hypothetical protein